MRAIILNLTWRSCKASTINYTNFDTTHHIPTLCVTLLHTNWFWWHNCYQSHESITFICELYTIIIFSSSTKTFQFPIRMNSISKSAAQKNKWHEKCRIPQWKTASQNWEREKKRSYDLFNTNYAMCIVAVLFVVNAKCFSMCFENGLHSRHRQRIENRKRPTLCISQT